jgi:hypothetical protein
MKQMVDVCHVHLIQPTDPPEIVSGLNTTMKALDVAYLAKEKELQRYLKRKDSNS